MPTENEPTIGPRQTVDRCIHPQLGPGRAIFNNGPAFFIADSGEVVPMRDIGGGGAGTAASSRGRYSYLAARQLDGTTVELSDLDLQGGDRHHRVYAHDGRPGWLVNVACPIEWAASVREWRYRFEADDGAVVEMRPHEIFVGLKRRRGKAKTPANEEHWLTLAWKGGQWSYQHERDHVAQAATAAPKEPKQLAIPGTT